MLKPLYVRELTSNEKAALEQGLKSKSGFKVKRCQILLSSVGGKKAQTISREVHCSDQTVRNVIRAFEQEGLACLVEKSHARHDLAPEIDERGQTRLRELVKDSPREHGHPSSLWTRALLAQTLHQEKLTTKVVSVSALGRALKQAGVNWRRAKKWLRSPDVHYERRKKDEIGSKPSLPDEPTGC